MRDVLLSLLTIIYEAFIITLFTDSRINDGFIMKHFTGSLIKMDLLLNTLFVLWFVIDL